MPNYSLQINSRFRPFSFQERLAPWQLYGQAYKELAESYNALGVQAGDVASMLNRELDKEAYEQYQGYMQGLKENADTLASEGLSPALKNNIYNMSNRYSQEIRPIQKAAERRQLLAEEQRKAGNAMIFDFDAATTGLDKFMNNPTINYRSIDRRDLLQRSQAQFGQFAKELKTFQKDPSMYSDAFHNTLVAQYGFTPEEASQLTAEIASGNITSDAAVARVANNLYNSTGVGQWGSQEASDAVWSTIAEGAVAGIGQITPQVITDEKKLADYKYQQNLNLMREKQKMAEEAAERKAKEKAAEEALRYFYQGSMSYLDANGQATKYRDLIKGLTRTDDAGNTILDKSVFGENGNVNPLELYERAHNNKEDVLNEEGFYDRDFTESEAKRYQALIAPLQQQIDNAQGPQKKLLERNNHKVMEKIRRDILREGSDNYVANQYGVQRLLTKDEYNMLKDLGYTSSSEIPTLESINDAFNNTSSLRTAYSLRMSGYEKPTQWASSYLNWLDTNGQFKGNIYKLNSDGTQGSPIKNISDLNIKSVDENGKSSGRDITDIQYSPYTKNNIIIELGNKDRYLVPRNIFGDEIGMMIEDYANTKIGGTTATGHKITSETDRAFQIHQLLVEMMNGYNPVAPNTSAKAGSGVNALSLDDYDEFLVD